MPSTKITLQKDVILKSYTTFKIGGPARYFVEVVAIEDLREVFLFCNENMIPFFVLGKGSNTLFDDLGFNGVVILNKIQHIHWHENEVTVGAGYSFSLLGVQAAKKGLGGLEFAAGIPGSVGGAVYMNAGATGQETQTTLKSVVYLGIEGELKTYTKKELLFGNRFSSFQNMKGSIVEATFSLELSEEARKRQLGYIEYRTSTQPYGDASAGCVFRNPAGKSAGALIDSLGLKGTIRGGASISSKHANFVINAQDAKAKDVLDLIDYIKEKVKSSYNEELEMEIRFVPHDGI